MHKAAKIGVVGATGLVGREILSVLQERNFPVDKLVLLASERSAGDAIAFRDQTLTVQLATPESFEGLDMVLMSAGSEVSKTLAPEAVARGVTVIDNSSAWRQTPEVPLVVPEVNAHVLDGKKGACIIANPNCSTIQMMVAIAPLHRVWGLRRVVVSTYQAVSGRGQAGVSELSDQVTALLSQKDVKSTAFAQRIAFNCLPQIDDFTSEGHTKEELKMRHESRKILDSPGLGVMATCVRVPVFNGHSLSIWAEFDQPVSRSLATDLLTQAEGIIVKDDPKLGLYPTVIDAEGSDTTYVGRIRSDEQHPNALSLWCVADNLRKGAATNAVQIAEHVQKRLG